MADRLERWTKKRTVARRMVTNTMNKLKAQLEADAVDKEAIQECLDQLIDKETILQATDAEIEDIIPIEDIEEDFAASQGYRENILVWKRKAQRFLSEPASNGGNETETENSQQQPSVVRSSDVAVKLPRLEIRKFFGDATTWQEFWSQFDTALHSNTFLTKVDKFNYLKSYLGGTAASAIAGLPLTDANYDSAVEILTERFGRKDVVISSHMNKLLALRPVKKVSDLTALRKLYDECEIQVRSLESMGVASKMYGALLCPVLMKLVPDEIALGYSRKQKSNETWDVSMLLEYLRDEIESRERMLFITKDEPALKQTYNVSSQVRQKKSDAREVRYIPSSAALNAITDLRCIFCGAKEHKSEDCVDRTVDEKKKLIKTQGRCFVCLKARHLAKYCRSKIVCAHCQKRHNKAICDQGPKNNVVGSEAVVASVSPTGNQGSILLQTVQAKAVGMKSNETVRCLLDGGAQRSFIREDISRRLRLEVLGEETLELYTFGSNKPVRTVRRKVKLHLNSMSDPKINIVIEALEAPEVSSAIIEVPGTEIISKLKEKGLVLADTCAKADSRNKLSVLIGSDYYWQVVKGDMLRMSSSLVALETIFGWTVHGPTNVHSLNVGSIAVMKSIAHSSDTEEILASEQLKRFWELEAIGIIDNQKTPDEEDQALQLFNDSVKFKDGRYEVQLPWKRDWAELGDNLSVADKRFHSLLKRLQKNVPMYTQYDDIFRDYLNKGIIEEVKTESKISDRPVYYLPHQAVYREDKLTTKLRIVFDASSHEQGCPSLNDCLWTGPNLNPNLLHLLLRFRCFKVAFTADIEKAFLQISLAEKDRDAVRFLWITKVAPEEEVTIKTFRLTRVLFGVTSSPFLLTATIKNHVKKYRDSNPDSSQLLENNLYVDDLIGGADNTEDAFRISSEAKEIMQEGGMSLRKWVTNEPELRDRWVNSALEENPHQLPVSLGSDRMKVLGLAWETRSDSFTFEIRGLLKFLTVRKNTKRYLLQTAGRIFDPLGFITPFTIRIKCLFQELWERGTPWDEEIPVDLRECWLQWCTELPMLQDIKLPRFILRTVTDEACTEIQIHCFSDASKKAYGAVVYLRFTTTAGEIKTNLIASKSRVAPLKKFTLPRLELMGALVAARLATSIREVIGQTLNAELYFWTDSKITLYWIKGSSKRWKPFVENRVNEIQSLTDPESWFHCSGVDNPADLISRGQNLQRLKGNERWWFGPSWLMKEKEDWPKTDVPKEPSEEVESEMRKTCQVYIQSNKAATDPEKPEPLLELNNFSSLSRVIRITAWILRFISNTKNPANKQNGELSTEETSAAELYWIKQIQNEAFHPEIIALANRKPINKDSRIKTLNPFLDEDGILRVGGRLQQSDFNFEQRHPIILTENSRFTKMKVLESHLKVLHSGLSSTLTQVREKFWILRGRQVVKKIIRKCFVCKKFAAKTASVPMAPLPRERVSESPPFNVTGIDFAGPLYIKNRTNTEKAYIALFTCAVTRAVHLELVTNMSTETFLLAFRRFVSRRGLCRVIFSDNARTFKRAEKELHEIWKNLKNAELQKFFTQQGIVWKYIVERAAWWGGFWERMVRSVKTCLKKILGRALLTYEEMETTLAEVEAVLNSRPISYLHQEKDEPSPLTPSHFLVGQRITAVPEHKAVTDERSNKKNLSRRLQYRERLLSRFWEKWRNLYILDLRSAHHLNPQGSEELKVNAIVLIADPNVPRQLWKMGRIVSVFPGRDHKVRSCAVRLPSGVVMKRPVKLLCPLEVD